MSTRDELNRANQEHGGNSDFFKFEKSGVYKLRLLTKPLALATHFFGKGQSSHVCYGEDKGCPFHGAGAPTDDKGGEKRASVKFITYVVDQSGDKKIKLAELPYSVVSAVADLEEDEDFKFDTYPMPYDIKITYDKENKDPKQMYKTLGSPNRMSVPADFLNALFEKNKTNSIENYIQKRKDKELEKQKEDGTWQKEQNRRENVKNEINEMRKDAQSTAPDVEYPENDGVDIPF